MSDQAGGMDEDLVPLGEGDTPPGGDVDPRGWGVVAGDGTWLGSVSGVLLDRASGQPRYLEVAMDPSVARQQGGRAAFIPTAEARMDAVAGRVHLDAAEGVTAHLLPAHPSGGDAPLSPLTSAAAGAPALPADRDEPRMQVSEEALEIGKRVVSTGEVRVHKRVQLEQVREVVPLMREDVTVERRPLPAGAGLEPRQEGDTLYIPILEEELVIQKRLIAREELVIRKRQVVEEQVVEETLRRETAEVLGPDEAPVDDPAR